jgi:Tfp pilus assembly protein FimT
MKRNHAQALTLIEILFVCAILGILLFIVTSVFSSIAKKQSVESDASLILSVLNQARSQTLSSQNASQYGVHLASSTVTLFTGPTYNPADTSNQVYFLNQRDTVLTVSLNGGGYDVVFLKLNGETTQDGTLTITSLQASTVKTISIFKTGIVEAQ